MSRTPSGVRGPKRATSPKSPILTRPNTSVTNYQYDTLNRLTELSNKTSLAEIINQYAYVYNPQDQLSSETITNGSPITTFQDELITCDYNKVNQLLSSTPPAKSFIYDADGNMTQGYTPEGCVFTAAYDAENRLTSLEYTDSGSIIHKTEYIYSGDGLLARIKKYENSVLISDTRVVRDGFLALQERDASNAVVREYVWGLNMGGGIGGLLNLNQGGQNYNYLYDGKGNVTALIGNTQNVSISYTYDAFGNLMAKTGTVDQPYRYSTKRFDEQTGLSYFGYRYYNPAIGKWLTRDPIEEAGGINLYAYVLNNPINLIDPFGLKNPLPKLPSFSEAFPESDFVAPVGDIVVGGLEAAGAVAAGVAAGVSFVAGPEFWWITLPTAPFSIEAGWDAYGRIKTGIQRLGDNSPCP